MDQVNPSLILGTAMWGWITPKETSFKLLDYFYEQGFRAIDGATNYPINKSPQDFRRAEQILQEWIKINDIEDLKVMMKVGSLNNLRSPEQNLSPSFLLMCLDEYQSLFGENLDTFMIHWDNRENEKEIQSTLKALGKAQEKGFKIGLSGIRYPEIYSQLNKKLQFNFSIQIKHNLLHSDYDRYQAFHGQTRFITYGINAGGIKLNLNSYLENSSLKARGGDISQIHPLTNKLQAILIEENKVANRPVIERFNHCGMAYAYHSPDIQGILLGTSRLEQLKDTLSFYQHLQDYDYNSLYQKLKLLK